MFSLSLLKLLCCLVGLLPMAARKFSLGSRGLGAGFLMELGTVFIFHSFCWPFLGLTTPFRDPAQVLASDDSLNTERVSQGSFLLSHCMFHVSEKDLFADLGKTLWSVGGFRSGFAASSQISSNTVTCPLLHPRPMEVTAPLLQWEFCSCHQVLISWDVEGSLGNSSLSSAPAWLL